MSSPLPKDHPLTQKKVLTLSDLKKEPLIVPVKGFDTEVHALILKGFDSNVEVRPL